MYVLCILTFDYFVVTMLTVGMETYFWYEGSMCRDMKKQKAFLLVVWTITIFDDSRVSAFLL